MLKYMQTEQNSRNEITDQNIKSSEAPEKIENLEKVEKQIKLVRRKKLTYRISYCERKKMKHKNIIIINFEGAIGDILFERFDDQVEKILNLRKGKSKIRCYYDTSSNASTVQSCNGM